MSVEVIEPGVLSLLQDSGRRGHHRLGLTNGGALDGEAYHYCNRLLQNPAGAVVVEVSLGGLVLRAHTGTFACVTGAPVPVTLNGEQQESWQVFALRTGDRLALGHSRRGARAYLGVAGGFEVPPVFDSVSTVVREALGGLDGGPLKKGDHLPCAQVSERRTLSLAPEHRPRYANTLTVRVIPGYQQHWFSREQQRRFFGGPYLVTERCDRMGYRLEGHAVQCDRQDMLSEGICHGAVQLPPDGQPIVLLNDRQTIGGYPKIGVALSLDTWRLAQLVPGNTVHFAPISVHTARRALDLAHRFTLARPLKER